MAKYHVYPWGVLGYGMWPSVPKEIAEEAMREAWEEHCATAWDNARPPFSPVIRRHPPTYQEWLDSLPWKRMPMCVPCDDSPDKGLSRLRFRGYRDQVTMDYGRPMRLRFAEFELRPPNGRKGRSRRRERARAAAKIHGPQNRHTDASQPSRMQPESKYLIEIRPSWGGPVLPPKDLVQRVEELVRRAMELGRPPEELDPEVAQHVRLNPYHPDYIEAWRLGLPLPR